VILTNLQAGGANSFLAVQAGPIMTMPPTSTDPSPLLGWAHIYNNQLNTNLLPALGLNQGLAPGSYTFWMNETDGTNAYPYGLNFVVETDANPAAVAVPAISRFTAVMLAAALGMAALLQLRWRQA
jgi:hypothetical protein